jgi:hypothetical protein
MFRPVCSSVVLRALSLAGKRQPRERGVRTKHGSNMARRSLADAPRGRPRPSPRKAKVSSVYLEEKFLGDASERPLGNSTSCSHLFVVVVAVVLVSNLTCRRLMTRRDVKEGGKPNDPMTRHGVTMATRRDARLRPRPRLSVRTFLLTVFVSSSSSSSSSPSHVKTRRTLV